MLSAHPIVQTILDTPLLYWSAHIILGLMPVFLVLLGLRTFYLVEYNEKSSRFGDGAFLIRGVVAAVLGFAFSTVIWSELFRTTPWESDIGKVFMEFDLWVLSLHLNYNLKDLLDILFFSDWYPIIVWCVIAVLMIFHPGRFFVASFFTTWWFYKILLTLIISGSGFLIAGVFYGGVFLLTAAMVTPAARR
jgi:hypothetical protein